MADNYHWGNNDESNEADATKTGPKTRQTKEDKKGERVGGKEDCDCVEERGKEEGKRKRYNSLKENVVMIDKFVTKAWWPLSEFDKI